MVIVSLKQGLSWEKSSFPVPVLVLFCSQPRHVMTAGQRRAAVRTSEPCPRPVPSAAGGVPGSSRGPGKAWHDCLVTRSLCVLWDLLGFNSHFVSWADMGD